jgi:hypothetical protein
LLGIGDLAVLQHLEIIEDAFDRVGRFGAAHDLGALFGAVRDDAGFELLAALVKRFDALLHRIAHRDRGINGDHHHKRCKTGQQRADEKYIDAKQLGVNGFHILCLPVQISKLTILAMMNTPMLIHVRPPRPVMIRR